MKKILCLLCFWLPLAVQASGLALGSPTFVSGGGTSQSGNLQIRDSIGQPIASGGGTGLTTGFWNALSGPGLASPVLTLVAAPAPAGFNAPVTASVTVMPASATGSVQFLTNQVTFGSPVTLAGGSATSLPITNLPRGTNALTAEYSGDDTFLAGAVTITEVVTNHPPVAGVVNIVRPAGMNVLIALSDLATNWTDADGDSIGLAGINPVSSHGVTLLLVNLTTNLNGTYVITNDAFIGYDNPSNINDQITYSIDDGQGGTNVGVVNFLTSSNALAGQATGIRITGDKGVSLDFSGLPGYAYALQRSTNLVEWATIWTTNAPSSGLFTFVDYFGDLGGYSPASAYYRVTWAP